MKETLPNCARCSIKAAERLCRKEGGKHPKNCPTAADKGLIEKTLRIYKEPENFVFARTASIQEKEGYSNRELGYEKVRPAKLRIEKIIEFIGRMGYRRIGMAFCMGLRKEAGMVEKIFAARGLDMVSAICKIGRVAKEELGLKDDEKISVGQFESMCNPILQAEVLLTM